MADIIIQIIVTLLLISGVSIGEIISSIIFGIPKKWYLNILEIIIFVIMLILMFNNVYTKMPNILLMILVNFFFGLISVIISRAIITLSGFFAIKIKNKSFLKSEINEETLIIGLTRNLLIKGFNKEDIKIILENSGFKKKNLKIIKELNMYEAETLGTKKNQYKSS